MSIDKVSKYLNIYDVIGIDSDPIYTKINDLELYETIDIDGYQIQKTDKFYVIVYKDEIHEWFKKSVDCYNFLIKTTDERK